MTHRPAILVLLTATAAAAMPGAASAYTLKRTETGAVVHWRQGEVRFRVGDCEGIDRADVERAAEIAADAWRGFPGVPDIAIVRGDPGAMGYRGDGRDINGIYLLPEWPFRDRHLAVTASTHDVPTGQIVDTDILINGEMPFSLMNEGRPARRRYDLASVLAHEMGHVLGLGETDQEGATMWPRTRRGQVDQRTLETDDEEGVLAIYGPGGEAASLDAGCSISSLASPGTDIRFLAIALVLGLFAVRRRRAPCQRG